MEHSMVLKQMLNCLMFSEENTNAVLSNSISNFPKDSTCNIEVERLNNKSSKLTNVQNMTMNIKNKRKKKNRRRPRRKVRRRQRRRIRRSQRRRLRRRKLGRRRGRRKLSPSQWQRRLNDHCQKYHNSCCLQRIKDLYISKMKR